METQTTELESVTPLIDLKCGALVIKMSYCRQFVKPNSSHCNIYGRSDGSFDNAYVSNGSRNSSHCDIVTSGVI